MSKIKAVCFDLDGVYFTPKGKQSFHDALSQEFGAEQEKVDEFMYRSDTMALFVRGKISVGIFFNRMRTELGITKTNQEIVTRWVQDYEINEQVREVVLNVRSMGFKTCVCTNNNSARLDALDEKFSFFDDFDVVMSSHMVGDAKPSPIIFEALLSELDILPEELLYSDDNPGRLSGANKLGIKTFVYENFEQFVDELKKNGINI